MNLQATMTTCLLTAKTTVCHMDFEITFNCTLGYATTAEAPLLLSIAKQPPPNNCGSYVQKMCKLRNGVWGYIPGFRIGWCSKNTNYVEFSGIGPAGQ